MDESYGTYVDDEYFDNHDYDDTDDDTDDDNDHKKDSYTAAGAAPGPHGSPGGTFYPEEGPGSENRKFYMEVVPAREPCFGMNDHPLTAMKLSI